MAEDLEVEYQPVLRSKASAASVQGIAYVWGGEEVIDSSAAVTREVANRIDSFDPFLETWSSLTTSGHPPPSGLCDGACASSGHYLYICGGYDTSKRYDTHLYQLNVRSLTWKQLPSYPTEKGQHCYIERSEMVCNQHKVALWGGVVSNIPVRPTVNDGTWISKSNLIVFDFKNGTWSTPSLTGKHPSFCDIATLTMIDDHRAILFGGRFFFDTTPILFVLDLNLMQWEEVFVGVDTPFPQWELINATAVCLGYGGESPQLLVIGKKTTNESCAWLLDVFSWQWSKLSLPRDSGLLEHGFSATAVRTETTDSVVIFGKETKVLIFGIQRLQDLCVSKISSALLQQKTLKPKDIVCGFPDYIPANIKQHITHSLKKPCNKIVFSNVSRI